MDGEIRELMDKAEKENWTVEVLFRELPEELTAPVQEDETWKTRNKTIHCLPLKSKVR